MIRLARTLILPALLLLVGCPAEPGPGEQSVWMRVERELADDPLLHAAVLAAMLIYGVTPGLGMLGRHLDVTMALVVTLALGNLMVTMLGLVFTGQIAKVTLVPYPLLAAVLLPLVFIAAYQNVNAWGDILVVCGMGILGLTMKWLGWPRPPIILGFILGPIIEQNLWPAIQVWGFGMLYRPLSLTLLVLSIAAVIYMSKAMGKGSIAATVIASSEVADEPGLGGPTLEGGGSGVAAAAVVGNGVLRSRIPAISFTWRWEVIFPLVILGITAWVLWEAQHFAIAGDLLFGQRRLQRAGGAAGADGADQVDNGDGQPHHRDQQQPHPWRLERADGAKAHQGQCEPHHRAPCQQRQHDQCSDDPLPHDAVPR